MLNSMITAYCKFLLENFGFMEYFLTFEILFCDTFKGWISFLQHFVKTTLYCNVIFKVAPKMTKVKMCHKNAYIFAKQARMIESLYTYT